MVSCCIPHFLPHVNRSVYNQFVGRYHKVYANQERPAAVSPAKSYVSMWKTLSLSLSSLFCVCSHAYESPLKLTVRHN